MLRRGGIQLGPRRESGFLETGRKGESQHDPLACRQFLRLLADIGEFVLQRREIGEFLVEFAGGGPERMRMAVVKAGEDGFALGVDHRGAPADVLADGLVRADLENAIALNRDGFGDREFRIDRQHLGVVDDEVGGRRFPVVGGSDFNDAGSNQEEKKVTLHEAPQRNEEIHRRLPRNVVV